MEQYDISRLEGKIDALSGIISSQGERIATLEATIKGDHANGSFFKAVVIQMIPQVISGLIMLGGILVVVEKMAK